MYFACTGLPALSYIMEFVLANLAVIRFLARAASEAAVQESSPKTFLYFGLAHPYEQRPGRIWRQIPGKTLVSGWEGPSLLWLLVFKPLSRGVAAHERCRARFPLSKEVPIAQRRWGYVFVK
jgi:hypothetical protein